VNSVGWCFADGALRSEWVARVNNAINSGVADEWINTPVALAQCEDNGIDAADCANYLIDGFTTNILSSTGESTQYMSQCEFLNEMNPTSFTQDTCQCDYTCNAPLWERCGDDGCMDSFNQVCVSGYISDSIQITRRRALASQCPRGHEVCRSRSGSLAWECLDTQSDIEACGGCPHTEGSVDCTALASTGASAVSCRVGKCVVESCSRGYRLVQGECRELRTSRR
jgi:hypothetical protein